MEDERKLDEDISELVDRAEEQNKNSEFTDFDDDNTSNVECYYFTCIT